MSRPLVSVVVTAHKRKEFMAEAINSALNQTIPRSEFEVIVVKDFEDAYIDDLIEKNGLKPISYSDDVLGMMLAKAINAASGEIIAFLDDDDIWEPGRLSEVLEIFNSHPNLALYHNSLTFIDQSGASLDAPPSWDPTEIIGELKEIKLDSGKLTQCDVLKLVHMSLTFNLSSMAIQRDVILPHMDALSTLPASPDDFMILAALGSGKVVIADDRKLTRYRIHSMNVSTHATVDLAKVLERQHYWRELQLSAFDLLLREFRRASPVLVSILDCYITNAMVIERLISETNGRGGVAHLASRQIQQTLKYAICRRSSFTLPGGKFGLRYDASLSFLMVVCLIFPKLAKWLYRAIYLK